MTILSRTAGLLLASLGLFTASCQKNSPDPKTETQPAQQLVTVGYNQTYCSDPWGTVNGNQQQLVQVATAYLLQRGVHYQHVKFASGGTAPACAMCVCSTGVKFVGTVPQTELAAAQALGFAQL